MPEGCFSLLCSLPKPVRRFKRAIMRIDAKNGDRGQVSEVRGQGLAADHADGADGRKKVGRWAVASVGPLAETEKVAGKESRAQDIGRDVTEGEAAIVGEKLGTGKESVGVCEKS